MENEVLNASYRGIKFWCPCCHASALREDADTLNCSSCHSLFPYGHGIPILINEKNSVFSMADYLADSPYQGASYGGASDRAVGIKSFYRKIVRSLSEFGVAISQVNASSAVADVCRSSENKPKILVIGAGERRFEGNADFFYTDVAFGTSICAIVDAHDLPFEDHLFDLVVLSAVLEHVVDPHRVADEVWRVMKVSGFVFSDIPFLQPVHMGAFDFTRFTLLGHRRVFRRFSLISMGMSVGPGAAFAWSLRSLILSLSSNVHYRRFANLFALTIGVPFKVLDLVVSRNSHTSDFAAATYFYGKKSLEVLGDKDLISLYRG